MSRFWSRLTHDLRPYVPGEQPSMAELVKLNTNESPIDPSLSGERVVRLASRVLGAPMAICARLDGDGVGRLSSCGLDETVVPHAGLLYADFEAVAGVALIAELGADPRFAAWARAAAALASARP